MSPEVGRGVILRFAAFELDVNAGELRKSGVLLKLRPQACKVLALLASRSGQLVTREEIQREIWDDGSVVDFEQGLNFCVRQIRAALGDHADSPRFVETIPRRGYRFLVPVTPGRTDAASAPPAPAASHAGRTIALAAAVLVAGAVLALQFRPAVAPRNGESRQHMMPLTSYPGFERDPSLSPDGGYIAFSWDGEKQNNYDIYVKPLRTGVPTRLTTAPAEDAHPAFSPDGSAIAFLRRVDATHSDLMVVPAAAGSAERTIAQIGCDSRFVLCSLAWTPDGAWLAAPHCETPEGRTALFLFSLLTGERRPLTDPAGRFEGDFTPAFSPDGRNLAFTRRHGFAAGEIWVLPLTPLSEPAGAARRLTNANRWSTQPFWTADGRRLAYRYAEGHEAPNELWSVAAFDAPSPGFVLPLEDAMAGWALGRYLVYARGSHDTNIWRAEIPPTGQPPVAPQLLISSTRRDGLAHYSPDGSRIAFSSTRSGAWEIWTADAAGSNPVQLTSFGGPHVAMMAWSPDGREIAFHGFPSFPEGNFFVFTIPSAGGAHRRLTLDGFDGHTPAYSRDGKWMYFSSRRSGRIEIYRIPAGREEQPGDAVQITHGDGGSQPTESVDGKFVYYCHGSLDKGIWRVPASGGAAVQVTGPSAREGCGLAVVAEGLYYIPAPDGRNSRSIDFVSFADGRSRPVVVSSQPFEMSLDISRDGRHLIFSQTDHAGSDLMLIEDHPFK